MPIIFDEPVYPLQEAARKLQITVETLRNKISMELIRCEQLGPFRGAKVITRSELLRFERERRPVGNPDFVKKSRAKRGV